jgi:hypothetical protein
VNTTVSVLRQRSFAIDVLELLEKFGIVLRHLLIAFAH